MNYVSRGRSEAQFLAPWQISQPFFFFFFYWFQLHAFYSHFITHEYNRLQSMPFTRQSVINVYSTFLNSLYTPDPLQRRCSVNKMITCFRVCQPLIFSFDSERNGKLSCSIFLPPCSFGRLIGRRLRLGGAAGLFSFGEHVEKGKQKYMLSEFGSESTVLILLWKLVCSLW